MPTKEIKELRQAGKLDEAYVMAKSELDADMNNIWSKRNLSWVLYAQLDLYASNLDSFITKLNEVNELNLPESEEMFYDNISIVISKAARSLIQNSKLDLNKLHLLFDSIKSLPIKRNSKWFSVLFQSFHRGMKESYRYTEFADWWDFNNFRPEDFEKEKLPSGKEVMALVEQAYIAYSKQLLPQKNSNGEIVFNKSKVIEFLPQLSKIVDNFPQFQYPAYFNAKLLLALGDKDHMLESLLPFARKKKNDFWVWEILSEAFSTDPELYFACYCKALLCKAPEEMLVGIRQKMAKLLIEKNQYAEAKTEIELLLKARIDHGFNIPVEVLNWQNSEWFKLAVSNKSNIHFYKTYASLAESLLYQDVSEEVVIVEFINNDKKILNFIASEKKYGFFKFDRFFSNVQIGETLLVRFQNGVNDGIFQVYTAVKIDDKQFKNSYIKEIKGLVKISTGKSFGFVDDVYIHPNIISKYKLSDGTEFSGKAIKTYNREKGIWSWKVI